MLKSFLNTLQKPFPETESLQKQYLYVIGVGFFIFLFLYFLEPFGMPQYPGSKLVMCGGFGLITIVIGITYEWFTTIVIGLKKDLPSWTLFKWILSTMGLLVCIAVGNFIYMAFFLGGRIIEWSFFFEMVFNTILIGVIPVIFSGLLTQNKAQKRNEANALAIQSQLKSPTLLSETILLSSHNQKQQIELLLPDLYYLESKQNYTAVYYQNDGVGKETLLRNTLSELERQLANTSVIRCHRSFLVNLKLVETVEGNAQGLRLGLSGLSESSIPVSRKYIAFLREQLKK